jgi:hypothetical protein
VFRRLRTSRVKRKSWLQKAIAQTRFADISVPDRHTRLLSPMDASWFITSRHAAALWGSVAHAVCRLPKEDGDHTDRGRCSIYNTIGREPRRRFTSEHTHMRTSVRVMTVLFRLDELSLARAAVRPHPARRALLSFRRRVATFSCTLFLLCTTRSSQAHRNVEYDRHSRTCCSNPASTNKRRHDDPARGRREDRLVSTSPGARFGTALHRVQLTAETGPHPTQQCSRHILMRRSTDTARL